MKRTITIVLTAAVALSMTACDALDAILQVNIFAPLYEVSATKIEDSKGDAQALLEQSESDTFYETLADPKNATLKTEVLATIDAAIAAATTPAVIQDLTLLGAEIELKTTGGDEVVNNVAAVLVDQSAIQDPVSGELDPARLLTAIMPANVVSSDGTVTDAAAFKAIIDGFVAADAYYTALGTSLDGGTYADTTVSAGAVAQNALVSAMIAGITPPPGVSSGEYLLDIVNGEAAAPADFAFPDMAAGSPLGNLFTAAGIDLATLAF